METHENPTTEDGTHAPDTERASEPSTAMPMDPQPAFDPRSAALPNYARPQEKSPLLAAVLSCVPGLGNIYNGLYARGISFAIAFVVLVRIASTIHRDQEVAMIVPTMIFFFFFNVFDAYRQANLINLGYGTDPAVAAHQAQQEPGGGLLVPGILLTALGTFSVLDRYLNIYVWDVLDHWPIPALLLGIYLIWRSIQARR